MSGCFCRYPAHWLQLSYRELQTGWADLSSWKAVEQSLLGATLRHTEQGDGWEQPVCFTSGTLCLMHLHSPTLCSRTTSSMDMARALLDAFFDFSKASAWPPSTL